MPMAPCGPASPLWARGAHWACRTLRSRLARVSLGTLCAGQRVAHGRIFHAHDLESLCAWSADVAEPDIEVTQGAIGVAHGERWKDDDFVAEPEARGQRYRLPCGGQLHELKARPHAQRGVQAGGDELRLKRSQTGDIDGGNGQDLRLRDVDGATLGD